MTVRIGAFDDAQQVEPILEQIVDIYREAFGQAPYYKDEHEVRSFARVLPQHMQRAGFRCVIVQDEETHAIVGFAYGYTGAEGQWWHNLVLRDMSDEDAALWMSDVFEVVELAVRPSAQGHGYGGKIHDALLAGRPHHTAALSTYDVETTALKLYEKRGWVTLLRHFIFPGYTDPYRIMGKKLR
jgi:GNAT superfamily N-acetyltransferase